jgi:hypothetical protein
MKKIIVMLFCTLAAHAAISQKLYAGLKAGVNISNFTGDSFDDVEKNALVGFHAGGFLHFSVANIIAIQPELLISTAGAKIEDLGESIKLTYITVPVMVQVNPGGGFYLEAGPQVGFKIGEEIGDTPVEDFAKNLDLSFCAGLGLKTKSGFGIGGRYNIGISKVGDFDGFSGLDPDFRNGVIQLGIFFRLGGSKK